MKRKTLGDEIEGEPVKQELEVIHPWELSEIKFQEITTEAIEKMSCQYLALTIAGINDTEGYEKVHKARMVVVKHRTTTTKTGKEMREKANEWNKKVLAEEKRILALLAPVEEHLDAEETKIDNEKARIKAEAEAKEAARIQARVDRLEALGMGLVAGYYRLPFGEISIAIQSVQTVADDKWEEGLIVIKKAIDVENARLDENERIRKAEADRLAKVAEEQEAERKRLDAEAKRIADEQAAREAEIKAEQDRVRKEQEDREATLKAAQDALEAEKKALADAKQKTLDDARHAQELDVARQEAAEKAKAEAEEKAKQDAEEVERKRLEVIEQERLAKIAQEEEAKRQEELRPDKEKLLDFADQLNEILGPVLNDKRAIGILTKAKTAISEIAERIKKAVELI